MTDLQKLAQLVKEGFRVREGSWISSSALGSGRYLIDQKVALDNVARSMGLGEHYVSAAYIMLAYTNDAIDWAAKVLGEVRDETSADIIALATHHGTDSMN